MAQFVQAENQDLPRIEAFYDRMIEHLRGKPQSPKWEKGIYPRHEDFEQAILEKNLYFLEEDQRILAAMVLNQNCTPGYEQADWSVQAAPEQTYYLHLLAVDPQFQRQGIARRMIKEACKKIHMEKGKALRLDVIEENLPAYQTYLRMGFHKAGKERLFYEDTGWKDFYLFELEIPA